ncbi:MAG: 2Fe-2S iron-sulfur cluster-binding protein, partial [Bdellovibrionota bacterium]
HDVPMQHACGGFCACTTCHIRVKSGMEHLSEMEEDETDRLDNVADDRQESSRLGCQAKIHGDIVVEIVNLDA